MFNYCSVTNSLPLIGVVNVIEAHLSAAARYLNPQKYSEQTCGLPGLMLSKCIKVE